MDKRVADGHLIEGVGPAWREILSQLDKDPEFLYKIPPRQFEELIAAASESRS